MNNKGFITFVEVMIIVAIIALLCAIAIPNLLRVKQGQYIKECVAEGKAQEWCETEVYEGRYVPNSKGNSEANSRRESPVN